jgi:hypothetical protein
MPMQVRYHCKNYDQQTTHYRIEWTKDNLSGDVSSYLAKPGAIPSVSSIDWNGDRAGEAEPSLLPQEKGKDECIQVIHERRSSYEAAAAGL